MKHDIVIPNMGESISEATVGEILKPTGSAVETDDEILELETDKVNQVLYAPASGVINLTVSPEQVVKIGDVIGFVDGEGVPQAPEPPASKAEELKMAPAPQPQKALTGEVRKGKESFVAEVKAGPQPQAPQAAPRPAAPQAAAPAPELQPAAGERRERRVPMSRIRQVIARRLVEAQHTTAMLTTFNEIDMGPVMELRKKYKDQFIKKYDTKLGFMSFFVKACVMALQEIPEINASIDENEVIYRDYYDIGIAVGTEKGLVVPVVRDCEKKSFAEIEKAIVGYAKKAREGKLSIDDLTGGGFTITNGGVYGSLLSTPILNPPQSGILGMHKIEQRPVAIDGEVVIKPMMYVALSYDHRIVDGQGAVTFLVKVKEALEDPARMILEL